MAHSQFFNRELSWLTSNHWVPEETHDESVPPMEQGKFLAIFSSNLEEYCMVRVERFSWRIATGGCEAGPDGLTSAQTLAATSGLSIVCLKRNKETHAVSRVSL